jgi:hypothetical protein
MREAWDALKFPGLPCATARVVYPLSKRDMSYQGNFLAHAYLKAGRRYKGDVLIEFLDGTATFERLDIQRG